jgi:surface protein
MNNLNTYIIEKLHLNKDIKPVYHYHPEGRDELKSLIEKLIEERGLNADLNDIDVSNVTNMYGMFYKSEFNGDISSWDVSNVEDMYGMFFDSKFNQDISKWNVSNVKDIRYMFKNSPLENNLPKWYHE